MKQKLVKRAAGRYRVQLLRDSGELIVETREMRKPTNAYGCSGALMERIKQAKNPEQMIRRIRAHG